MRRHSMLDPILRWSGLAALVITAGWNYFKFDLSGGTDWMVNISIATEVLPYAQDLRLLVIHVKTKNPTSSRLTFERQLSSFKLRIHEVPSNLQSTRVLNFDKQPELVPDIDLMATDGTARIYMPGAEFDDSEVIVVRANTTLHLEATLTRKEGFRQESDDVSAEHTVHIDVR